MEKFLWKKICEKKSVEKILWKNFCGKIYGWGYIGRGLKGGFKPKSGSKNQFSSIAQKINIGSLGRKSGRNLLKMGYFLKVLTTICK